MLKFIVLFFAAFAVFSPLFLIGIRKYKVQGIEQGVHLVVGLLGGEVDPIYPPGAQGGGDEKDVLLLVEGLPEAVVGLPGQVAVSEPGVIQAPELVQADVESPEVL